MLRALLVAVVLVSCQDRLAYLQGTCRGTWELESREMADGTVLRPPDIVGVMYWEPIDARKAHVATTIIVKGDNYRMDHSASTYEVSTSAITRKRHFLRRRGIVRRRSAFRVMRLTSHEKGSWLSRMMARSS
jgi:hypothetical protein